MQAIRNDIQEVVNKISNVGSISGRVETTVNSIEAANIAMTQLDTINNTYLQPLSTFNTVVIGIANVCLSNQYRSRFDARSCVDSSICSDGVECIDHGIQGMCSLSVSMPSIHAFLDSSFSRKQTWTHPFGTSLPRSNRPTSSSWKTSHRRRSTQSEM